MLHNNHQLWHATRGRAAAAPGTEGFPHALLPHTPLSTLPQCTASAATEPPAATGREPRHPANAACILTWMTLGSWRRTSGGRECALSIR